MSSKVIIGNLGASGAIYGWRLLERLRAHGGVEIHLILTRSGEKTLFLETGKSAAELEALGFFLSHGGYRLPAGQRILPPPTRWSSRRAPSTRCPPSPAESVPT